MKKQKKDYAEDIYEDDYDEFDDDVDANKKNTIKDQNDIDEYY